MLDPELLFYGAVFLAVLLLVEGLFMMLGGRRARRQVNRRMQMRADGAGTEKVMHTLRRGGPGRRAPHGLLGMLDGLLAHAGWAMTLGRLLTLMAALAAIVAAPLIMVQHMPPLFALPIALAAGIGVPLVLMKLAARRRIKQFNAQLPDALDMVVRSLRAGHPTTAALKLVSEQMPDPIGSEVGLAVDEMTYGLDLQEALESMLARMPSHDLAFMVTAMRLQSRSGGNLTEVLASLARVIRERGRFLLRVKALSAQARFSAWAISLTPFGLFAIVNIFNPDYYGDVTNDPMFVPGMILSASLMTLGVVTIVRMVKFRY